MSAAPDLSTAIWRKASLSESANGCVEVARLGGARVAVRDSKNTAKPAHVYPLADWAAFLDCLRGCRPAGGTRIKVEIGPIGVTLHDRGSSTGPHHYTHYEWMCFVEGIRNREPQLAAAL